MDGPVAVAGRGHRSLETLSGLQWRKRPFTRGWLVTVGSAAPDKRALVPNQGPLPPPGGRALQVGPALPDPSCQWPRGRRVLGTAGGKWTGRHRCLAKTKAL